MGKLLFDETTYQSLPQAKKPLFLFQWLQRLPEIMRQSDKTELVQSQKQLEGQLKKLFQEPLGPPARHQLANCYAVLYKTGKSFTLNETINRCCDTLKTKTDEASASLNNKLISIEVLGGLFEQLGGMAGSSFPEAVQVLIKSTKVPEYRSEVLHTLRKIIAGLGVSSASCHKDVYKCVRTFIVDRSLVVRCSAAQCALELVKSSSFIYLQDIDSFSSLCYKSLEGSNYELRCCIAQLLGTLVALMLKPQQPGAAKGKGKQMSTEDCLNVLSNGFIKGAVGFLKSGGSELRAISSTSPIREVRVGITQAYAVLFTEMGGVWLEKHLSIVTKHVLDLLASPKTISTHIDAVYSRKCVSFIFKTVFRRLFGEPMQIVAARQLLLVAKSLCGVKATKGQDETDWAIVTSSSGSGGINNQHILVCAMLEVGRLVQAVNTAALPLLVGDNTSTNQDTESGTSGKGILMETLDLVLRSTSMAARLAAAWCMRCVAKALPSQLCNLVTTCLTKLEQFKSKPDAVCGYSQALAGLMGNVKTSELGLPSSKAKKVLTVAEELLQAAENAGNTLAVPYTQAGWLLIGAFCCLGANIVRGQLTRLVVLWRNSFPHSVKDATVEQAKGNLQSWIITLEGRAGSLASILSFLASCPELLLPDVIKRVMLPINSAISMLPTLPTLVKSHGMQLKASTAMIRLRLYQCLYHLPSTSYEHLFNTILRELVAEFSLTDNPADTTTSLLRSMCHQDDSIILGSWLEETDHKDVEEQLQLNSASGSGAFEHDPTCVYINDSSVIPGPLPLGVSVIDASVVLFGRTFPNVSTKHRLQLLSHFSECIKQAKSHRQQVIQINIFTAFLAALKNLIDAKSSLGKEGTLESAHALVKGALANSNPILQCAAGEALGRLLQVADDAKFIADVAQASFDVLKTSRDAVCRTGHSLVLGCLHRYVGGMGSGQHLQTSVGILHALAQDGTVPLVQVWVLHALALVADSGGPLFRNYVEPTLTLTLSLLMSTPFSHVEVHQCLAKCLSALITTLGPELQVPSSSITALRQICLVCCEIVQQHPDPVVQSAAIGCLQQVQLYAPQFVSLPTLLPNLISSLDSSHLLLRRASAICLRQFCQREPNIVWNITSSSLDGQMTNLEKKLLNMLDVGVDSELQFNLKEIIFSLVTSLAPEDPMHWLLLCNGVLSAANPATAQGMPAPSSSSREEDEDDDTKFTTGEETTVLTKMSPRWPTKVFAVECSRKIYTVCRNSPAHCDLSLARRSHEEKGGDYLVMHLSELVRTSFIAATANVDQFRLAGYQALQDVIELFAASSDPDYQGHVLLEQYQAQIGAALRPAFGPDTPPHVTAMACQVCSKWLGSGISRDLNDLRRVQQLLVSSLDKLNKDNMQQFVEQPNPSFIYGEAVSTLESLAVLKAWAELYIKVAQESTAKGDFSQEGQASALDLVNPHLPILSQYWLSALKDYACLNLSPQLSAQLPTSGGTFYSQEVAEKVKPFYDDCWSSILHAAAIWLQLVGFEMEISSDGASHFPGLAGQMMTQADPRTDQFYLTLGLAIKALCTPSILDSPSLIQSCLFALEAVLSSQFAQGQLAGDSQLGIELLSMCHRLLITCHQPGMRRITMKLVSLVGQAFTKSGENLEDTTTAGKSVSFGIIQAVACCLIKLVPSLASEATGPVASQSKPYSKEDVQLVSFALSTLPYALKLCSIQASIQVLPSLLYIVLSSVKHMTVLRAGSPQLMSEYSDALASVIGALKVIVSHVGDNEKLVNIIRSSFGALLNNTATEEGSNLVPDDKETLLVLLVTILKVNAVLCTSDSELFDKSVSAFKAALKSNDAKVELKAIQSCTSLFTHPTKYVSVSFIHALGPCLVEYMEEKDCHSKEVATNIIEAIKLLEYLVELVDDSSNRLQMLNLLIPLLISLLVDTDKLRSVSNGQSIVHANALERLKLMGPKYPSEFKTIITSHPKLKKALESALKASQEAGKNVNASSSAGSFVKQPVQPTIKLKMDFSNFK